MMAHSPSLQYFYSLCTGYFFEFKKTFMFVKEFLLSSAILLLAGILGNFALKIKNNFLPFLKEILHMAYVHASLEEQLFCYYIFISYIVNLYISDYIDAFHTKKKG